VLKRKGFDVDANTTMTDVLLSLNIPAVKPCAIKSATRTSGPVKLLVNFLSDFRGAPLDYKEWEETTVATVRQMYFASVLDNVPEDCNLEQGLLNKKFHKHGAL
jgi:hypothetical protein